jgi:hypothetical protein
VPGTGAPAAAGRGGIRVGIDALSEGERERVREGIDELLFGSGAGRPRGAGQGLCGARGNLAGGQVHCAARALFQPATEGAESGALSGGAEQEAGRFDGRRLRAGWCNERIHGAVAAVHDSAVAFFFIGIRPRI